MEMKRAMTGDKPSSNVHSVGYDPTTNTLAVCYLDRDKKSAGPTYHYEGVEPHHHAEMMKPEVSTGAYLRQHIIKGEYKFKKQ